jgi:hypothetical protein
MPIFGRRQSQQMLDELGPWLEPGKAKDLLKRLENVRPNQALPAEYELAISWAVSKIATLEIDRPAGGRTPDIYSTDLLRSGPLMADVAALDDFSLSGADTMRRACNILNAEADRHLFGSPGHLHYTFRETSGYERAKNGRSAFFRRRLVRRDFELDANLSNTLKSWLATTSPRPPLSLSTPAISALIEWRDYVHPSANHFCSMPSLAYHLRDNPLYAALRLKSKQLRSAPEGARRLVFLGDAGCGMLRDLDTHPPMGNHFRGGQVILKFLKDYPEIDFVMVVSASRERASSGAKSNRFWKTRLFTGPRGIEDADAERLNLLVKGMLPPQLSGYSAYSWHEQGMCEPDSIGKYVPVHIGFGKERMTLKISARAVQELMAGRLSVENFQRRAMGNDNFVRQQLEMGEA